MFSERSLLAMVHGVVLGGTALMACAAALFAMSVLHSAGESWAGSDRQARALGRLSVFLAAVLWLAVIAGTYVVFPPYRATPPAGLADLSAYPRSLLLSNPETEWLHAFAMESKEHMPWIAAMLATTVAFLCTRCRGLLLADPSLRRMALALLSVCFGLTAFAGLMGILVDKAAPLQ